MHPNIPRNIFYVDPHNNGVQRLNLILYNPNTHVRETIDCPYIGQQQAFAPLNRDILAHSLPALINIIDQLFPGTEYHIDICMSHRPTSHTEILDGWHIIGKGQHPNNTILQIIRNNAPDMNNRRSLMPIVPVLPCTGTDDFAHIIQSMVSVIEQRYAPIPNIPNFLYGEHTIEYRSKLPHCPHVELIVEHGHDRTPPYAVNTTARFLAYRWHSLSIKEPITSPLEVDRPTNISHHEHILTLRALNADHSAHIANVKQEITALFDQYYQCPNPYGL